MNINDLSAAELARIDAICMQYEADLREGRAPSIDSVITHVGGEHSDLLRMELTAIAQELQTTANAKVITTPFQIPPLAKPNLGTADAEVRSVGAAATSDSNANIASRSDATLAKQKPQQVKPSVSDASLFQAPLANADSGGSSESESNQPKAPLPFSASSLAAAAKSADEIQLPVEGDRIGPYIIGGPLGQGGMGAVFSATDTRLDRQVAIKVLSVGGTKRQELNDRFEREAKAVAALSHPNIVELFDVGVVNDLPYAVMELLRGETLADRVEQGRLTAQEVRYIGAQIADALATAHDAGVIHRDLKPQNVMILGKQGSRPGDSGLDAVASAVSGSNLADKQTTLTPSRFELATNRKLTESGSHTALVKVFDFGLSHVSSSTIQDDAMETKAGAVMGTPGYMAPEQVRGETITGAVDLFALGCVMHRCFYGSDPIVGATVAERFANTLTPPTLGDQAIVAQDGELADLILRCLAQSPDDRPESASQLATLLRQSPLVDDPVMSQLNSGYSSGEMFRRRFLASLTGGVVGAVSGTLILPNKITALHEIRSLAVLSLDGVVSDPDHRGAPIGTRKLGPGEELSALLVNELAQLNDVAVPPYRALHASTVSDFQRLGKELNVDAFVTGSVVPGRVGDVKYLDVDLRIVSASTGRQLWGHKERKEIGDNLVQQSQLATDIASQIGRRLTATLQQVSAPASESYHCLIDGKVRAEPDSKMGMEMALKCLSRAKELDPTYVQPAAGLALVSITLAWQSDAVQAEKLVVQAIEATQSALKLDKDSVDARLADAMIQWQRLFHFADAKSDLGLLAMQHPYHWQVQHQYGLLLLSMGLQDDAQRALGDAARLNAMSMLVRTDATRAFWFAGNSERAISDCRRLLVEQNDSVPAQEFAKGLLIDIFEQQGDYEQAAAVDDKFVAPTALDRDRYFAQRAVRIKKLPYGPFGDKMNRVILDARLQRNLNDSFADPVSPALPLLLAVHPALSELRGLDRAKEMMA